MLICQTLNMKKVMSLKPKNEIFKSKFKNDKNPLTLLKDVMKT